MTDIELLQTLYQVWLDSPSTVSLREEKLLITRFWLPVHPDTSPAALQARAQLQKMVGQGWPVIFRENRGFELREIPDIQQ